MNLAEVMVASAVFLGACSGAAQMGASSAAAMALSRQRSAALEQFELQVLAVDPVLQAAEVPEALSCNAAALWMQEQLRRDLPPLPAGLQRQLSLSPSGQQVELVLRAGAGQQRMRVLSPAALGLCGSDPSNSMENGDAALDDSL